MDGAENYEFASPLGPKRNIVYDVRNMPVAIQMRTGDTLFKYDGNGNRVQKYSPEGVVTYVTDTYEIRGMENIALYLGNVRFAEFDGEKATYFLRDHINSASVSMDEDGTVSENAEYLPFGSPRASEEITSTDYTFTDQEKDRSTGLFNYDARHYDPRTGRFVSPDSILPDAYDPQQLNRYAYARNNPLRYVDPSGHQDVQNNNQQKIEPSEDVKKIIKEDIPLEEDYVAELIIATTIVVASGVVANVITTYRVLRYANKVIQRARNQIINDEQTWSSTNNQTSFENALSHFEKHKNEFSNIKNLKQYVNKANEFVKNPPKGSLIKTRANGDVLIYDPKTNTFAVKQSNGIPKTMFKPSEGLNYWRKQ